jgi:hypothetical protein
MAQDQFACSWLLHFCCFSLIDGIVEMARLEEAFLDVSVFHLIFLLLEHGDPCIETPSTFERSGDMFSVRLDPVDLHKHFTFHSVLQKFSVIFLASLLRRYISYSLLGDVGSGPLTGRAARM